MSRFFTLLWAIIFILPFIIHAQNAPLVKVWDKTYGGVGENDLMLNILPTSDGGYLLGGSSDSDTGGDKSQNSYGLQDFWVVKVDAHGNKLWDKTFGSWDADQLDKICLSSDGGYLLGGSSDSPMAGDKSEESRGNDDYWIVKIDAQGNKLWDKTFGGVNADYLHQVTLCSDGGYLLLGSSSSNQGADKSENSRGADDYWIVKIDAQGNKLWDKTFGGQGFDNCIAAVSTSDGGFLLAGSSNSNQGFDKSENNKGSSDYWIIKVDAQGNKLWDKTLGGNAPDEFNSICSTSDGGYLLGGSSSSNPGADKSENSRGANDYWIIKVDAQGNKLWDKTIGGQDTDYFMSMSMDGGGGYLLGGYSYSEQGGDKSENCRGASDYWMVKIDAQGNKLWDKTLGSNANDEMTGICNASNEGFLLGGISESNQLFDKSENSKGGADFWLIKIIDYSNAPNLSGQLQAIEPQFYGNQGKVRMNLYGSPFDPSSTARLVRSGYPDIIAESVVYLDSFLIQAVFNVDQKEIGRYSIMTTMRGGQTTTLVDAFRLESVRYGEVHAQIISQSMTRPNATINTIIKLNQDGNTSIRNIPFWIAVDASTIVTPNFHVFEGEQLVWQEYQWNAPAFIHNGKKYYALMIPTLPVDKSVAVSVMLQSLLNIGQNFTIEAFVTQPWGDLPLNGSNCLQSGLASVISEAVPQARTHPNYLSALQNSVLNLETQLVFQTQTEEGKSFPTLLTQSQVYYASVGQALGNMNISPTLSEQNALKNGIKDLFLGLSEAHSTGKQIQCTPEHWTTNQLCIDATEKQLPKSAQYLVTSDNGETPNPESDASQQIVCLSNSDFYVPRCKSSLTIQVVGSCDPNQKNGINQKYVTTVEKLPYLIEFENKPEASAPAHEVFITDTLDANVFDLKTFRFGAVGFGAHFATPAVDYPKMQTQIDMRPLKPYIVSVKGELNSNVVKWHFATLDAQTLLPINDPMGGFLPPNQVSPDGQGFVFFSIASKSDAPTGTSYKNRATIIFDLNEPIITNTYENISDKIMPDSRVGSLPSQITNTSFSVNWFGNDSGSGINDYTVWVAENDGDYREWLVNTTFTQAFFVGKVGNRYRFYSISRDKAGNVETIPNTPDAQTMIVSLSQQEVFNPLKPYLFDCSPNPFAMGEATQVSYYVPSPQNVRLIVLDLNGLVIKELFNGRSKTGKQTVELNGLQAGIYTIKMTANSFAGYRKIVVTQ